MPLRTRLRMPENEARVTRLKEALALHDRGRGDRGRGQISIAGKSVPRGKARTFDTDELRSLYPWNADAGLTSTHCLNSFRAYFRVEREHPVVPALRRRRFHERLGLNRTTAAGHIDARPSPPESERSLVVEPLT
jgi:hypothetical protein